MAKIEDRAARRRSRRPRSTTTSARKCGCACTACRSSCARPSSAPSTCSCRTWSRARAICRSARRRLATGFAAAMKPGDLSFCTYRGHAHTLARGVPVEKVLGELMQRDNGLMRGKGGSMHLTSVEHGVMGSYAIIGAHLPIACGAAWRAQYKGDKDVSVCFFGDGTTNIGAFHEALNFAAVWKLPVIFVLREQPLHGIHADRRRDRGRASGRRPRRRLRAAAHRHRRQRRRRRLSRRARRLREGARRRRPVADRVHDLSPQRPFARRSGEIPPRGRAREMEGARPDARSIASGSSSSASPTTSSARSRPTCGAWSTRRPRSCKAAPMPPLDILTTDVYADGGFAWRN